MDEEQKSAVEDIETLDEILSARGMACIFHGELEQAVAWNCPFCGWSGIEVYVVLKTLELEDDEDATIITVHCPSCAKAGNA